MNDVFLGDKCQVTANGAGSGLLHRVGAAGELSEERFVQRICVGRVMNSSNESKNGLPSCAA